MFASILGHVKGIQMYEKGELSQQRNYKDIGVMLEGTNQSAAIFYPLWSVAMQLQMCKRWGSCSHSMDVFHVDSPRFARLGSLLGF